MAKGRPLSLALLIVFWAALQIGGLFTPGLLDDVDSVYLQIAREMLRRHDWVTPTIAGIRFFDKPPLMYWMAAVSMRIFGAYDWAGRLPLALSVLVLLISVYFLGLRLLRSTAFAERGAFLSSLTLATCIGPYLYTRFYIPDIVVALWLALAVQALLIADDRAAVGRSTVWAWAAYGGAVALNVLTKGIIGLLFPVAISLLFLAWQHRLRLLRGPGWLAAVVTFVLVAAPWHVLAALRNPAVPMPPGLGLPSRAGWLWFYGYNEHVARFLGKRIPHDYGQVPIPVFWLLLVLWLAPWAVFLPGALWNGWRSLRRPGAVLPPSLVRLSVVWAGFVLLFFTAGSRQEYYHLPALPALALLTGAWLAAAENDVTAARWVRTAQWKVLTPVALVLACICAYYALAVPRPAPGVTLTEALSANPALYNLSLGHIFDLTNAAMAFFRGPLLAVSCGLLLLGPAAALLRARSPLGSSLLIGCGMTLVLLAAHVGLVRFYPTLGSKGIADIMHSTPGLASPQVPLLIDGELTSGSSLLFYTDNPVYLVNGRVNGPWFGSFFPDAPHIFLDDAQLLQTWRAPRRALLMTYHPRERIAFLCGGGGAVYSVGGFGDKVLLSNEPVQTLPNACSR